MSQQSIQSTIPVSAIHFDHDQKRQVLWKLYQQVEMECKGSQKSLLKDERWKMLMESFEEKAAGSLIQFRQMIQNHQMLLKNQSDNSENITSKSRQRKDIQLLECIQDCINENQIKVERQELLEYNKRLEQIKIQKEQLAKQKQRNETNELERLQKLNEDKEQNNQQRNEPPKSKITVVSDKLITNQGIQKSPRDMNKQKLSYEKMVQDQPNKLETPKKEQPDTDNTKNKSNKNPKIKLMAGSQEIQKPSTKHLSNDPKEEAFNKNQPQKYSQEKQIVEQIITYDDNDNDHVSYEQNLDNKIIHNSTLKKGSPFKSQDKNKEETFQDQIFFKAQPTVSDQNQENARKLSSKLPAIQIPNKPNKSEKIKQSISSILEIIKQFIKANINFKQQVRQLFENGSFEDFVKDIRQIYEENQTNYREITKIIRTPY